MAYEQVGVLVWAAMQDWWTTSAHISDRSLASADWTQIRRQVIQDTGWSVDDFNAEFERRLTETEIGISEWLDRQNENYPFVE
jgi:hypothetical protein